jgi:hypothetical protein
MADDVRGRPVPGVTRHLARLAPAFAHRARLRDALATGWPVPEGRRPLVAAAFGHAVAFSTWRSLVREQGLDDAQAVAAMAALVRCLASDG